MQVAHVREYKMIKFHIIETSMLCKRNLTHLFVLTDQPRPNFKDLYHLYYYHPLNLMLNALILK